MNVKNPTPVVVVISGNTISICGFYKNGSNRRTRYALVLDHVDFGRHFGGQCYLVRYSFTHKSLQTGYDVQNIPLEIVNFS